MRSAPGIMLGIEGERGGWCGLATERVVTPWLENGGRRLWKVVGRECCVTVGRWQLRCRWPLMARVRWYDVRAAMPLGRQQPADDHDVSIVWARARQCSKPRSRPRATSFSRPKRRAKKGPTKSVAKTLSPAFKQLSEDGCPGQNSPANSCTITSFTNVTLWFLSLFVFFWFCICLYHTQWKQ